MAQRIKLKEASKIKSCLTDYQNNFLSTNNWIDSLIWDDQNKESSLSAGIIQINRFIENCFISMSKSILSGEYILKDVNSVLDELMNITVFESSPDTECEYQNKLYERFQQLNNDLYNIAKNYKQKIAIVNDKVNLKSNNLIINAISFKGSNINNKLFKILSDYVLEVCFKEHILSYKLNDIKELILIKESASVFKSTLSSKSKLIIETVDEKCLFLLKKLLHQDGDSLYAIDFNTKHINGKSEDLKFLDQIYKNYLYFQTPSSYPKEIIRQWQNSCYTKNQTKASYMVSLMRYYSCNNATLTQIENLVNSFNELYNNILPSFSDRPFDILALKSIKNYMYNCKLSFRLKQRVCTLETFKELIEEIVTLQKETCISNFHPHKKAVEYLIKSIKSDLQASNFLEEIECEKFLMLEESLKNLEKSINWCKEQRYYPFQLMYNECISANAQLGIVIFTPSSYSKPIRYNELEEELQQLKSEVHLLKNKIELKNELQEIVVIKEDIEKNKRSSIEILGLFTAIITFLVGCISIFQGQKEGITLTEQIQYSISLGIILLMFVCMIYIITLPREKNWLDYLKQPKTWVFIVILLSCICTLLKCYNIFV